MSNLWNFWRIVEVLRRFLKLHASPSASEASIRWSESLKVLAHSKSSVGYMYLVELALFKLDGEAGSER